MARSVCSVLIFIAYIIVSFVCITSLTSGKEIPSKRLGYNITPFIRHLQKRKTEDHNNEEDNNTTPVNPTNIIIFADDNTPTLSNKNPIILKETIENQAKILTDWFSDNEMITSGDKTKLLIIGTKTNRRLKLENTNINIEGGNHVLEKKVMESPCPGKKILVTM